MCNTLRYSMPEVTWPHESRESPAGIDIKPPGRIECVGVYLALIDYLFWSVRSFSVDVFCIVLLLKQSL